ncbi:MAG: hypothetical protein CMJ64_12440 [Planctomycetaceae bacterium]|nr:hypothetical protein [Planctomycetaceae bacterium]
MIQSEFRGQQLSPDNLSHNLVSLFLVTRPLHQLCLLRPLFVGRTARQDGQVQLVGQLIGLVQARQPVQEDRLVHELDHLFAVEQEQSLIDRGLKAVVRLSGKAREHGEQRLQLPLEIPVDLLVDLPAQVGRARVLLLHLAFGPLNSRRQPPGHLQHAPAQLFWRQWAQRGNGESGCIGDARLFTGAW